MKILDKNSRAIKAADAAEESLRRIDRNPTKYHGIHITKRATSQGGHLNIEVTLIQDGSKDKSALAKIYRSIERYRLKNKVNCRTNIEHSGEGYLLTIKVEEEASFLRFRRGKFLSNFQRVQKLVDKFMDLLDEYATSMDKLPKKSADIEVIEQPAPESDTWQKHVKLAEQPKGLGGLLPK